MLLHIFTMNRLKKEPDETVEQFFEAVKIPDDWKFRKMANWDSTIGKVFETEPGLFMRVFFDNIPKRGGICQCDTRKRKVEFNCLISNKRGYQLNEWIDNYIKENEDEESD